jgi:hypothetical protein
MLEFLLSKSDSRVSRLQGLFESRICKHSGGGISIYPLTITEIAEAQTEDADLKALAKADKYEEQLVEDTLVYCKDCKLVIPKTLQRRTVEWYHHYLQHPGST